MRDAQTVDSHIGKVIRVRDDGSAPEDNPFAGKAGAKPEIYSYGHRNVQGVALRPGTDQIWTAEFGPQGGDEVNLTRPGANYGWPAITYGVDYGGGVISDKKSAPGMEQPVAYWVPSISPSGITFYDGDKFPQWRGNLFVAALSGHIRRLTLSGDKIVGQEELLARERERFRDVAQGPDGNLYALTDDDGGKLIRIEPAN
jgi:glucose/arabinose dehydrogenase